MLGALTKRNISSLSPSPPAEMTVEEWIEWMEKKKEQGMTEAQLQEYKRRKELWLKKHQEEEAERKRQEEEQKRKTREKMEAEYR